MKKEDAGARKGRKVTIHCVFSPMICGSRGSKSNLAKAAGAEPSGQMRTEKLHAVMRSTLPSQNVQNTSASEHLCTLLWCEAHVQVKMYKAHLLEVESLKKWTPLWREAHFQVKMYKTYHGQTTFGRSEVVSRGRRKGICTLPIVSKTNVTVLQQCQLQPPVHYITLHYNTLHSTTLHYTHYTTLQLYLQLHYNYNTKLH